MSISYTDVGIVYAVWRPLLAEAVIIKAISIQYVSWRQQLLLKENDM